MSRRVVRLGPCGFSSAADLASLILALSSTRDLRLDTVRFKGDTFGELLKSFAESKVLVVLWIENCGGSVGRYPELFGDMLSKNHSIERLVVIDCQLTPAAATAIAEGLANNPRIVSMDFSSNSIGLGIEEIGKALEKSPRPLTGFHLTKIDPHSGGKERGGQANEKIVDGLLACNSITQCLAQLSLGHLEGHFNNTSTPKLARLLEQCTCLQALQLSSTVIGRDAIRNVLAKMTGLTRLVMLQENYTDGLGVLEALTHILQHNPSIEQVSVGGFIVNVGAAATALWNMLRETPRWARSVEFLQGGTHTNKDIMLVGRGVLQASFELEPEDVRGLTSSEISEKFAVFWREMFIAFGMGIHPRIGNKSPVSVLGGDLVKIILQTLGR
jgi:hypothetical protein